MRWLNFWFSVFLLLGVVVGGTGCPSPSGSIPTATPVALELTPSLLSLAAGTSKDVKATIRYSDGTVADIDDASWSSNAATVTVKSGKVTGVKPGSATVTATSGQLSKSLAVTVTAANLVSLGITPTAPTLAKGLTQALVATGTFSDNTTQELTSQVAWASSSETTASVTPSGVVTALAVGSADLTATLNGVAATTTVTVSAATISSVALTPSAPSIAKGFTRQLTAVATFSDKTTLDVTAQAAWSSSDASVASVGAATGLVRAEKAGAANVTASVQGVSGSTAVTVTNAVLVSLGITPAAPTLAKGLKQPFIATGVFSDTTNGDLSTQVTWASSDEAKATISNAAGSHGLASTLTVGQTTISATLGTVSASTTLDVTAAELVSIGITPASPKVAKGLEQQFKAIGTYTDTTTEDLTTQVTWASSDIAKAEISNAALSHGLATTLAVGPTTITATLGTISGNTVLDVTAAELVAIEVTPSAPSIAKGLEQQFTATGIYTDTTTQDLTTQVTWDSSDPSTADVSNASGSHGLASTHAVGQTTISATIGAVSGSTTLVVTAAELVAIGVTPATASVAKGLTQHFTAVGTYTDTTTLDLTTQVTWASSHPSIADISNASGFHGLASTLAIGATTISATLGTITGDTTLDVTAAELVAIGVTPATPSVAKGSKQQFTATGTYTDTTTQNLTAQVTWASSDTATATISNAAGSHGLASAAAVGGTTISATLGTITGSTTLDVTAAELVAIGVTPATPSVAKGLKQQFTATGTYTDTTTQDLTAQVTWASSDTAKATISNAAGSNGLASTAAVGGTTISATLNGVTGSTTLDVTAATLVSIGVTPSTPSVAKGLTQQFVATGTYTDTTTQNLTTQVTWASSDGGKATISNAVGSKGLASTAGIGQTTISATLSSVTGSTTLDVTAATLVSIAVTPATPSVAKNLTKQFTATGTYTDTTTQNLTTQVTWTSSNPTAATISNAVGSKGLATTGSTAGISTTISATLSSVTGSTSLNVVTDSLVGSILATDAQAAQINAWIGTPGRSWQLCYRRSTHGGATTTFHANCDAANETVTVVSLNKGQSNERLIGGYAANSWAGGPDYVYGPSASFLFSLTNSFKHAHGGYSNDYSIFKYSGYGPTFGGGHDFLSGSNPVGNDAYCNFGHSYNCRIGAYGDPACYEDFCGAFNPTVSELEVFMP